jgi:DNA-binding FadR family transcriptional regulator
MAATEDTLIESRVSRAESMARLLESEIMDELAPPGSRLGTKSDLRARFGVAAATVTEAVRLLEMRGMVETRPGPGGGVFVVAGSAEMALSHLTLRFRAGSTTFSDCLVVRDLLEPLICREAARNHGADDAAALRRILDQMERQVDEPGEYMRLNYKLHRRIAKLSANAPLHRIYLSVLDLMERSLEAAELDDFDGETHLAEHRELVAAIDAGEGKRLEAAIARQSPSYAPR